MYKKNDPLVDAVKKVMDENCVRREAEKFVNEMYGIYSRKALPHEMCEEYDAVLAEATEIALTEGLNQLDEKLKSRLVKPKGDEVRARSLRTGKGSVRVSKHSDGSITTSSRTGDWNDDGGDLHTWSKIKSKKRRAVRSAFDAAREQISDMNEGLSDLVPSGIKRAYRSVAGNPESKTGSSENTSSGGGGIKANLGRTDKALNKDTSTASGYSADKGKPSDLQHAGHRTLQAIGKVRSASAAAGQGIHNLAHSAGYGHSKMGSDKNTDSGGSSSAHTTNVGRTSGRDQGTINQRNAETPKAAVSIDTAQANRKSFTDARRAVAAKSVSEESERMEEGAAEVWKDIKRDATRAYRSVAGNPESKTGSDANTNAGGGGISPPTRGSLHGGNQAPGAGSSTNASKSSDGNPAGETNAGRGVLSKAKGLWNTARDKDAESWKNDKASFRKIGDYVKGVRDRAGAAVNKTTADVDKAKSAVRRVMGEDTSLESIQEEIRNDLLSHLMEAYDSGEESFNALVDSLTEEQVDILQLDEKMNFVKKMKNVLGLRRREAKKKADNESELLSDYGGIRANQDSLKKQKSPKYSDSTNKEATKQYNIAKRNRTRLTKVAQGKKPFQECTLNELMGKGSKVKK